MKCHLDTDSRQAFERYTQAVSYVERYRISGRKDFVDKSEELLRKAQGDDPGWVKPVYLQSILKDITGDAEAAIRELERFSDFPDTFFALEVKYNLGAAHYHRYSEAHLNEASSSLAQVYGMRVLLKQPEDFARLKEHAKKAYDLCIAEAKSALRGLDKWKRSKSFESDRGGAWIADEIEWGATNAIGFAGSFWTDYLPAKARIPILEQSMAMFEKGLKLRPNQWATLSNLASAKMRLGYAFRAVEQVDKGECILSEALRDIERVLSPSVRPDYAFALYERGRILRLLGRFQDAIGSLLKLRALPPEKRDVSPATFEREIKRAENRQTYFLREAA